MSGIKNYRDLDVWQKGMNLVEHIYKITKKFPQEELYGLITQMRRSAISIPSNISEGFLRQHTNEMIQFLYIASGSCGELDTQLELARLLGYVKSDEADSYREEINHLLRMIRSLIKSLKKFRR